MSDSFSAWSKTLGYFPESKLYRGTEISTKIMFKKWCFVIFATKTVVRIFPSQFQFVFDGGFFLIEMPMGGIVGRQSSAIFNIRGRSYSTPKFEKSGLSEITFVKSISSCANFSML